MKAYVQPVPASLSRQRLRYLLHYSKATGHFTWRVDRRHNAKAGQRAGNWVSCGVRAGDGYWHVKVDSRAYRAHRLAWFYVMGTWPEREIDHRDGDGTNNRWRNLRLATRVQNMQNQRRSRTNTSGTTGVAWQRKNATWAAYITVAKQRRHLGQFTRQRDAVCARRRAERLVFQRFAASRGVARRLA